MSKRAEDLAKLQATAAALPGVKDLMDVYEGAGLYVAFAEEYMAAFNREIPSTLNNNSSGV